MKILWLIPLIVENEFFMASEKNEIARSIRDLGHCIDSIIGYTCALPPMDGFSNLQTVAIRKPRLLHKILYHIKMLKILFQKNADIVLFGIHSAHLIPFLWFKNLFSKKSLSVLDIRTIPVDVAQSLKDRIAVHRFTFALKIADLFCDSITFITPMMRDMLLPKMRRISLKNTCTFDTGVNMAHFNPEKTKNMRKELGIESRFVIVYHGTLSPNRGLQLAIKAMEKIKLDIPEAMFIIIGCGEAEKSLKLLVQQLRLEANVMFTGAISFQEIPDYITSANLALIPLPDIAWWRVSSPIKLKEYLSLGIPVLATDIDAHRNVIQKTGGGSLFKSCSADTIAEGILKFYRTNRQTYPPKTRQELSKLISYSAQSEILINHLFKIYRENFGYCDAENENLARNGNN